MEGGGCDWGDVAQGGTGSELGATCTGGGGA